MPRILTYNVRNCLGIDGQLSPERIADVIASCEPDVVALQELDVNRARTGGVDQAQVIADALCMQRHFYPAIRENEAFYGDAILTARPCTLVKADLLATRGRRSIRGAARRAVGIGECRRHGDPGLQHASRPAGVGPASANRHAARSRLARSSSLSRAGHRRGRLQHRSAFAHLPTAGRASPRRPDMARHVSQAANLSEPRAPPAARPCLRRPIDRGSEGGSDPHAPGPNCIGSPPSAGRFPRHRRRATRSSCGPLTGIH